jgi:MFS family permease
LIFCAIINRVGPKRESTSLNASRTDLRISTAEGAAASIMVGIGETYLPAFVLALSGSQLACGLVSTVPLVAGALLQLVSPWAVRRWQSHRRWVVFCILFQALTFVPLAGAAITGRMPLAVLFAVIALYWATGLAAGPAWNAWMETLVPERVRPRYFAWRTRISQWGIAAGFVGGGLALHAVAQRANHLGTFALLFLMAGASRLISTCLLASQREPLPPVGSSVLLTLRVRSALPRLLLRVRSRVLPMLRSVFLTLRVRFGLPSSRRTMSSRLTSPKRSVWFDQAHPTRSISNTGGVNRTLLLYLLAAQAAVQVAAPYFNPYMLGCLKFSYSAYVALICAPMIAKILVLPMLGRLVERCGAHRVFWQSAMAIVLLPGMWLVSSSFSWLVGIQVFSGIVWGANDLATLMLFFETIPREKRIGVLTLFNLANAVATAAGSLLGGALLAMFGTSAETYLVLFAISALARAAALVLLVPKPAGALLRQLKRAGRTVPVEPQSVPASLARQRHLQNPHWPSTADGRPAVTPHAAEKA